jgi:hypothetical protein
MPAPMTPAASLPTLTLTRPTTNPTPAPIASSDRAEDDIVQIWAMKIYFFGEFQE